MPLHKLLLLILLIGFINSYSQNHYKIKSCKIEYVYSNGFQTGTKTLIFTDYGMKEKEYTTVIPDTSLYSIIDKNDIAVKELIKTNIPKRLLSINDNDYTYLIDLDLMTGGKTPRMGMLFHQGDLGLHTKKIDTILNRVCDVFESNDGLTMWFWNGIALKKELKIDSVTIYESATSIDENYIIKEDEFKVPKGVKIKK